MHLKHDVKFADLNGLPWASSNLTWQNISDESGADSMHENDVSGIILKAAIEVHRTLGRPGLLECVYDEALAWELNQAGLVVRRQLEVPIRYKDQTLTAPLTLDLLVHNLVIVKCKSTHRYNEIFAAQV